jgi:3-(3-hydroxy-phenyl)propionate hydroxylase
LIETYHTERSAAADENILNSTRSTDFIAPRTETERALRDAALALAARADFAKRMVNSGRLSVPAAYRDSPLSTSDRDTWRGGPGPGAPIPDAPLSDVHLSEALGRDFNLLLFGAAPVIEPPGAAKIVRVDPSASEAWARFDAAPGTAYLIRPDTHVAARWRQLDAAGLTAALNRARGQT